MKLALALTTVLFALPTLATTQTNQANTQPLICENDLKKASEIESHVEPRLEQIRAERNLKNKLTMLVADLEAIESKDDDNSLKGTDQVEPDQVLSHLKKSKELLEKNELNVVERDVLLVSVNSVVNRFIWNSGRLVTELRVSDKGCKIQHGDVSWDNPLFGGLRAVVYPHRLGVVETTQASPSAPTYKGILSRIENVTSRHVAEASL